ncbi:MAG: AHH domain-containing protein [Deltaproteobacteria bacterium]|nr:AHH domain-containing protein [Deltaproteobacteria bacterium]
MTRHVGTYVEGDTCSHRWQASKRAIRDFSSGAIPYKSATAIARMRWGVAHLAKIATYVRQGKTAGVKRKYGGQQSFSLKPFSTFWWPWENNAHHIIPRSTLASVLDDISGAASPNEPTMFEVMVEGLLKEPYNLNDEPNMIMLPVRNDDAIDMGLPRHLEGSGVGTRDHPVYSDAVWAQTQGKLEPKYQALASAIANNKHQEDEDPPAVRSVLEGISNATYNAILAQAKLEYAAGSTDVSLDTVGPNMF